MAGILSLEDAARIVALRSRALTALSGRGGMLSIAEPAEAVRDRVKPWDDRVSVAAVNGPEATVVSGTPEALAEIEAGCEREGVRARLLPVDYASHGPQVDALREEIERLLDGVAPRPARIPIVSAMTGAYLEGPELDAGYWYASLRATVEFSRAIETLARDGHEVFIETSAHPVLATAVGAVLEQTQALEQAQALDRTRTPEQTQAPARTQAPERPGPDGDPAEPGSDRARSRRRTPVVTGTLRRDDGGAARLLASLAQAQVHGVPVDWAAVLPAGRRVDLPTYAFQHQKFWIEADRAAEGASPAENRFWTAVEDGDLAGLTDTLAVDPDRPFREALPALASWRQRERGTTGAADWRYRVIWAALPDPRPAALTGTWLLVTTPAQREQADSCAQALEAVGARTVLVEVAPGESGRRELAALLDGPTQVAGVLSLLALDESRLPGAPGVSSGLAGTLALLQALGDNGTEAPLWVLTRGARRRPRRAADRARPVDGVGAGPGRGAGAPRPLGRTHRPATGAGRTGPGPPGAAAGGRRHRSPEDQVAIRGGGLRGRRLVRAPRATPVTEPWTPTGTVLLTGGTGAIGARIGDWLAERRAPGSCCPAAPGRPPPEPPRWPPGWRNPAAPSRWWPATPPSGSTPPG
ncbi:acyltransferase domain-containing protein [Streptacidiphilus sp. 4-A2]|nr:acyltransferase domain-containing protein [Streptacidiphilus sp. 4-A2]